MITPRLNCILNNITGKTMADIGTDHAYIPIKLAQDNNFKSVLLGPRILRTETAPLVAISILQASFGDI